MTEVVARSWQDALDHLYAGSWQPHLARHRSTDAYRGIARAERGLRTGLSRLSDDPAALERHLLRNFIKYAKVRPDARHDSLWDWLAPAPHHRLPSRLLGWAYPPLGALHFGTGRAAALAQDGAGGGVGR